MFILELGKSTDLSDNPLAEGHFLTSYIRISITTEENAVHTSWLFSPFVLGTTNGSVDREVLHNLAYAMNMFISLVKTRLTLVFCNQE